MEFTINETEWAKFLKSKSVTIQLNVLKLLAIFRPEVYMYVSKLVMIAAAIPE